MKSPDQRHHLETGTQLAKSALCTGHNKISKALLVSLAVMVIWFLFCRWNIFQQPVEDLRAPYHIRAKQSVLSDSTHEAAAEENAPPSTWQKRAQFQQAQVEKFCQYHNMADMKHRLPTPDEGSFVYYQHMLVDEKTKTIFCFVPKAGCTNLKMLFFVTQGLIPESDLQQINKDRLGAVVDEHSFVHLSNTERLYALKDYFKFIMYRNPLERLVSGYRSKVERYPLIGRMAYTPHYNWLREEVYRFSHPVEYKAWYDSGSNIPVNISFPDFIDYWLSNPEQVQYDQHFRPILEICHPCRSRFDFYGNFRNLEEDAGVLGTRIHAKEEYLRHNYHSSTTETNYLLSSYYEQLKEEQKRSIFYRFLPELDFIYRIFPEELNTHKQILRIMDDVHSPASESVLPFTNMNASSTRQP